MPAASPAKWHLAHTSWFFEAVVLLPLGHCAAFDTRYLVLFNSYYEALGPRHPRPQRGLLSRPSLDEVRAYRLHVDEALQRFIAEADDATWQSAAPWACRRTIRRCRLWMRVWSTLSPTKTWLPTRWSLARPPCTPPVWRRYIASLHTRA